MGWDGEGNAVCGYVKSVYCPRALGAFLCVLDFDSVCVKSALFFYMIVKL